MAFQQNFEGAKIGMMFGAPSKGITFAGGEIGTLTDLPDPIPEGMFRGTTRIGKLLRVNGKPSRITPGAKIEVRGTTLYVNDVPYQEYLRGLPPVLPCKDQELPKELVWKLDHVKIQGTEGLYLLIDNNDYELLASIDTVEGVTSVPHILVNDINSENTLLIGDDGTLFVERGGNDQEIPKDPRREKLYEIASLLDNAWFNYVSTLDVGYALAPPKVRRWLVESGFIVCTVSLFEELFGVLD
jgi:hypothetical protein